jgi:hypothetical protein
MIPYPAVEQNTPAWHALRRGVPTASGFDRILTAGGKVSALSTREAYIHELIAQQLVPWWVDWDGNRYTERGKVMEPHARQAFVEITGHDVREVGFVTTDDGAVGCSPDGLIVCDGAYVAGLEIKCPTPKVHVGWVLDGELPAEYRQQVHGSMAVTGLPEWHFLSWFPDLRPLHLIVRWDDYTSAMAAALRDFAEMHAVAKHKAHRLLKSDRLLRLMGE